MSTMAEVDGPYDAPLSALIGDAFVRLDTRLREHAPTLATHTEAWMRALARGAPPPTYFTHPQAFPMLLLPWWLEGRIGGPRDLPFDGDLIYSTIAGYYAVRMVDELMDRDRPPDATAIPALICFQVEFQLALQRHFPADHPFWAAFTGGTFDSAEMASVDAGLTAIDRDRFVAISARKVAGARLPLQAVAHHRGRTDQIAPWSALVDLLGCWHQMANDIQGWHRDLASGRATYFLTEGAARTGNASAIPAWVVDEGLAWGIAQLDDWMDELIAAAERLECPPLAAYLAGRARTAADEWRALAPSLAAVQGIARSFGATD